MMGLVVSAIRGGRVPIWEVAWLTNSGALLLVPPTPGERGHNCAVDVAGTRRTP
jgi:hypothetical protein